MSQATQWDPERVVKISDALSLEWYLNNQIVSYVVSLMNPEVLDEWMRVALETIQQWPQTQPYLAMHDLSKRGVMVKYSSLVHSQVLNVGVRAASEPAVVATLQAKPDLVARVAINVSLDFSGNLGKLFLEAGARKRADAKIKFDVFYERQKAFQWLAGGLPKTSPS